MSVVKLVEKASVPIDGNESFQSWLTAWAEAFGAGNYGVIRGISMVVESGDGRIATVSQSSAKTDGARLAGLLLTAAHRVIDDNARIESLRE